MMFLIDFIGNWIHFRDIKEAWQDAKFKHNKEIQRELLIETMKLDSHIFKGKVLTKEEIDEIRIKSYDYVI